MREKLELVFESEERISVDEAKSALVSLGLKYKSAKRTKIDDLPKVIEATKGKGCCGGGRHKDKALPSISNRIMGYGKIIREWYRLGRPKVDRIEQLRRMIICDSCEFLNSDWHCSKCGCPMKEKVALDMDIKILCELNKW